MKILFISMPSIHVVRWIENLSGSGHDLYWFDILDRGEMEVSVPITQITGWKKRKLPHVKGEYFLRKKLPALYHTIQPFLETTVDEQLTKIIHLIQPDLVHSFEMQNCSYPLLKTMRQYPKLNWLYSCWGSDLFYYQNSKRDLPQIKGVLSRINYLHTDCERDYNLASSLGFEGVFSGVIPGGGGFHLDRFESSIMTHEDRKIILVKGYEHGIGRGLNSVKALHELLYDINEFEVVVFGAHQSVTEYIKENNLPFRIYDRNALLHLEIIALMGKSVIYIGNSSSDGMPNTLLEAIIMGAFPIQSNPGGVTAEIIDNSKNGLLINNPDDIQEIRIKISQALKDDELKRKAFEINQQIATERLDYQIIQQKIVALYHRIENELCE
ncbi:glycosyltransferase [Flavobacterium sp. GCM10027622]|uniref:glycosyltransferase n=1 Tax=unclassified Flavobacterium TaxID=196869 RepID=UPI00361FA37C